MCQNPHISPNKWTTIRHVPLPPQTNEVAYTMKVARTNCLPQTTKETTIIVLNFLVTTNVNSMAIFLVSAYKSQNGIFIMEFYYNTLKLNLTEIYDT